MAFDAPGGSETYLLTVAEQLQRLGHEVTLFTVDAGADGRRSPRTAGSASRPSLHALPAACDASLVQDGVVAYRLAERYPDAPQVFRAASDLHDLQLPLGPARGDERSRRAQRAGRGAGAQPRSRNTGRPLAAADRHPALHARLAPRDDRPPGAAARQLPPRAGDAASFVSDLRRRGDRRRAGRPAEPFALRPERAIWEADIVVAKGRAALEAMAVRPRGLRLRPVRLRRLGDAARPIRPWKRTTSRARRRRPSRTPSGSSPTCGTTTRRWASRTATSSSTGTAPGGTPRSSASFFGDVPPPTPSPERAAAGAGPARRGCSGRPRAARPGSSRPTWTFAPGSTRSSSSTRRSRASTNSSARRYEALAAEHRGLAELTTTRRYRLGMSLGRLADSLRRAAGLRR